MKEKSKRQQILRAAEKLFTSRRFDEVTTDDMMRVAGVGKGTIYRYFKNKDDLFFQVAISGFDKLCELLDKKVPKEASFKEKLVSVCQHISSYLTARRQLLRVMQIETSLVFWISEDVQKQCTIKIEVTVHSF